MPKNWALKNNDLVWIASSRGKVISRADVSTRTNKGACYMTYQWWIGKCNELTAEHLNPVQERRNTNTARFVLIKSKTKPGLNAMW